MMHHRPLWQDTFQPDRTFGERLSSGRFDTVVVGAGLTGLALGVMLAEDGDRVAIVEARGVGAVATGHTTAKVSLLQGTVLSQIRRRHGAAVAAAYVAGNRAGQRWLLDFLTAAGVAFQVRPAVGYATTSAGERSLRDELEATGEAGLATRWSTVTDLPFDVLGAVELPGQAQVHPLEMLHALAAAFVNRGGRLLLGSRVRRVSWATPLEIETAQGSLVADRVVLATGAPVLDRGSRSSRLRAERSYAMALGTTASPPAPLPQGMYLSADQPSRSVRTHPAPAGDYLIVGGNGHPVGRQEQAPRELVDELRTWAERTFPGYQASHVWSAQDYHSAGTLPLVGPVSPVRSSVYGATGYHKWGMTNGVAAALRLRGLLAGAEPDWAGELPAASVNAGTAVQLMRWNARTAASAANGLRRLARPRSADADGEGRVRFDHGRPVAECTVDGQTRRVSAVCPHLGGIVRWNNAELSWDCPLHGSRFDASGAVLEGPAVTGLAPAPPAG